MDTKWGQPSDEEAIAAIVAAFQSLVPSPSGDPSSYESDAAQSNSWRFSGRWWSEPLVLRRSRPH